MLNYVVTTSTHYLNIRRLVVHWGLLKLASGFQSSFWIPCESDLTFLSDWFDRECFLTGGPSRGSNHSIKSVRRDVDDIALNHFMGASASLPRQQIPAAPVGGYGRKDMDDMIINQHINANRTPNQHSRLAQAFFQRFCENSAAKKPSYFALRTKP